MINMEKRVLNRVDKEELNSLIPSTSFLNSALGEGTNTATKQVSI